MPRKEKSRWSGWSIPEVAFGDRGQNTIGELVHHALVDVDELAHLDDQRRKALENELAHAVGHYRAGVSIGKRGVGNKFSAAAIFHHDVIRALGAAQVPTTGWSRVYADGHESLADRVARVVGEACGIVLPKDTKRIVSAGASIIDG